MTSIFGTILAFIIVFRILVFVFEIGCKLKNSIGRRKIFAHYKPVIFRRLHKENLHR